MPARKAPYTVLVICWKSKISENVRFNKDFSEYDKKKRAYDNGKRDNLIETKRAQH
jgi:hypothetical protein